MNTVEQSQALSRASRSNQAKSGGNNFRRFWRDGTLARSIIISERADAACPSNAGISRIREKHKQTFVTDVAQKAIDESTSINPVIITGSTCSISG